MIANVRSWKSLLIIIFNQAPKKTIQKSKKKDFMGKEVRTATTAM